MLEANIFCKYYLNLFYYMKGCFVRNVLNFSFLQNAMILMNSYCNKIVKPIDGSCCLPLAPLSLIQKLTGCFFSICIIGCLVVTYFCHTWRRSKPNGDVESEEEKKPVTASLSTPEKLLFSLSKLGLIMGYFFLCDRADLFMKEQKYYTHSTFFIPLVYIIVLGVFYNDNTKEVFLIFFPHSILQHITCTEEHYFTLGMKLT